MSADWKRFIPVLAFVGRFLGIYIAGNLLYGWMVESYAPDADPITRSVTHQVAGVMSALGYHVMPYETESMAQVNLFWNNHTVLSLFEGCNGINVMIVWLAFLVAIGPVNRLMWTVAGAGLIVIHMLNLIRIILLFMVAEYSARQFYFVHKYLFTAFLYVAVFAGWWLWLRMRPAAKIPSEL